MTPHERLVEATDRYWTDTEFYYRVNVAANAARHLWQERTQQVMDEEMRSVLMQAACLGAHMATASIEDVIDSPSPGLLLARAPERTCFHPEGYFDD